jgi:hypothetical protein
MNEKVQKVFELRSCLSALIKAFTVGRNCELLV